MAWYAYWQRDPDSEWEIILAESRDAVVKKHAAPFTTVLDLDRAVDKEAFTAEDYAKIRYRGDFYVDFDGESLEEVIPQFQKFLRMLSEQHEVNLGQLELSATGGRGFHVIVPIGLMVPKPSSTGYSHLPHIYKEMAFSLYVRTLDMRVYSARRGRMWRTFNVKRANGNFKVQITPAEAMNMTPELYLSLCSAPRDRWAPEPVEGISPTLALLFSTSRDKVTAALEERAKRKSDPGALRAMRDNLPRSIRAVLDGEHIGEDVGFHQLAMQLAILAHALEWKEDELVDQAKGLIESHQSDGHRYNTPAKRQFELRRMYWYMDGNPCYEWSNGGLLSLVDDPSQFKDLDPKVAPAIEDEGELDEEELTPMCEGLVVRKSGIYMKYLDKQEGQMKSKQVASFGISEVSELINLDSGESVGFEVVVHSGGMQSRRRVTANDFDTKTALRRALGSPGHIKLTDAQSGAFQEVFRLMSDKGNRKMVSVGTEGVNVIARPANQPHPAGESDFYLWWVDSHSPFYLAAQGEREPTYSYRFDPIYGSPDSGRSDLQMAPYMQDTEEDRLYMDRLFTLYPLGVTAKVLGWHAAAFLAPLLRHNFKQFPALQSYGEAGGGKTTFNVVCAHLHSFRREPGLISAGSTPFALESPLAVSASIPMLYDEVKPREMPAATLNKFYMLLRNNYNGNAGAKGRINRDSGVSSLGVEATKNVAPMAFMSEQKLDQEAVLHRCVMVPFPAVQMASAGTEVIDMVKAESWRMGTLGRVILDMVLSLNVERFGTNFAKLRQEMQKAAFEQGVAMADRPLYNLAVVVAGLQMVAAALKRIFGDRYKYQMEALIEEIRTAPQAHLERPQSEINRVISDIAALSDRQPEDPLYLVPGQDWRRTTIRGKEVVEIHVRTAWDKYSRWCKQQGISPLFDREPAFFDALRRHAAIEDTICTLSPLKRGRNMARVVALSVRLMAEEGIEDFATAPDTK